MNDKAKISLERNERIAIEIMGCRREGNIFIAYDGRPYPDNYMLRFDQNPYLAWRMEERIKELGLWKEYAYEVIQTILVNEQQLYDLPYQDIEDLFADAAHLTSLEKAETAINMLDRLADQKRERDRS